MILKAYTNGVKHGGRRTSSSYPDVEPYGMTIDASDNIYLAGSFSAETDFDPGLGTDVHDPSFIDAFVSKFDSNGNFQWARTWGGSGADGANAVATDPSGNVIVGGSFDSTDADFDPGPGKDIHGTNGGDDAFAVEFTSSGDYRWARTWGSANVDENLWDSGNGVASDSKGNVYAVGHFRQYSRFRSRTRG